MSVGSLLDENSTVVLLLDYEHDTTAAVCSAYALPESPEDTYLASLYLSACDSPLVSSLYQSATENDINPKTDTFNRDSF